MPLRTIETDYLVVGAGAAGLAFADTLIAESTAEVLLVDRRGAPGGHWNDAYPFVRLHQPSAYYGVNSLALGGDALQTHGPEAGWYERATGAEIRAYYERVLYGHLIPSGQVRFLPFHDVVGHRRVISHLTGEEVEVRVRKRVVDAAYLSPAIPATSPPPFEVGEGASVIPVHRLTEVAGPPEGFVLIGAGKTAMDACVWLLENGVDPAEIQWIKPREAWLVNRRYAQSGALVGTLMEGVARQMEAAASAASPDDLFDRLESSEQFRRLDTGVRPTMYKSATIGDWEIELLRRVERVVRLGPVRRIDSQWIIHEGGTIPTTPGHIHVHCAADGLRRPPPVPIFAPGRITLQPVRAGLVPFNAALVAFVEAHRDDDGEKNRLCPPNPHPHIALDWARTALIQYQAEHLWSREEDLSEWLGRSRLNPMRGIRERFADPAVQGASRRFVTNVGPGLARLAELVRGVEG